MSPVTDSTTIQTYLTSEHRQVRASDGISYAYREVGDAHATIVLLQHFRGNLDNWDPALIDALSAERRVVMFDNAGVGGSSGTTPHTVGAMARNAIAFLEAVDLQEVDILGFSIGSFVAQEIALVRPTAVRRLVLAASAPQGAAGMHGWSPDVIGAVGGREPNPEGYLDVFYTRSSRSRQAGQESLRRMLSRSADRDKATTWQTRQAQYDAVCTWGVPNHAFLERATAIEAPTFIANGDSDPMIRPRYSHLLAGLVPDANVKIYSDSAHGFLFQHHEEFASDVLGFLGDPR
ncbi:MAG: alpha/beta fold hydrolase [Solirubrobacteraceae bacterium]